MNDHSVFIIEDNDTMRLGMKETLERDGFTVYEFANPAEALVEFEKSPVPLVITDLKMEPVTGLEVLSRIKQMRSSTEVLIVSAYGTVQTAVEAMHQGAADFLTKPFSPDELRIRVKKLTEAIRKDNQIERLEAEKQYYRDELSDRYRDMIGKSQAMQGVFDLISKVAVEDSSVLIEGESGTGKELVARAMHNESRRSGGPFIRLNCGALNDNLLESELFGHEKGSFTGAIRTKQGRFELADGGTLFLDEIGDISQMMQVKLLRVLQEKEFERVGGERTYNVDVRVIAATNRDLGRLISENRFREDLYYRLSVIPVKIPPLRERRSDIPYLIDHFLQKLNQGRPLQKEVTEEAVKILEEYSWPGNIRELENLLERLYVISAGDKIDAVQVSKFLGHRTPASPDYMGMQLGRALESFEKNMIIHALKEAGGVKNRAARILGIKTSTLYYKLEKYGLLT